MEDFELAEIKVNSFSSNWGPFIFVIPSASSEDSNDGLIPFGTSLVSAQVKAYVGTVSPGTDLADLNEVTTELIADSETLSDRVKIKFNYPGATYAGKNVCVIFICTLSNSAVQAFYFQSVSVQ